MARRLVACSLVLVAAVLTATGTAAAPDVRTLTAPPAGATASNQRTAPTPDPANARQGGDTMEEATLIAGIPFLTTGTTVGYSANCCWEMCPYEAMGPAVFYRFVPQDDVTIRADLCGSNYDTGLYIFDADWSVIACNIDHYSGPPCGLYVSCIEHAELLGGQEYYIVVTGMSGASGNYILEVTPFEPCTVDAPAGAVAEGEPPIEDDYADAYNGGCSSPEFGNPFQLLEGDSNGHLAFTGVAGWYVVGSYTSRRDTDWFRIVVGPTGSVDIELLGETPTYLFELGPQDCANVDVLQLALSEECTPASLQIQGEPGSEVWIWVGSDQFDAPYWYEGDEYDYLLIIDGLAPGTVAVEARTWSAIRGIFRN